MASIGSITLDPIQVVVANATVNVSYTVPFSSYESLPVSSTAWSAG
jgi:hypothetical protein